MNLQSEIKNTLTFVLAGGQGERLKPLTDTRAKPAVPFGGAYRIIDFTLSNCIHSGLRRIYVLSQYRARSLDEHVRFGWNFLPRRLEQFISVRPPHHHGQGRWYMGTADAICHNLDTVEDERPDHVLVLSGDHVYKMDYGRMLREHVERGSALTIGAVEIPVEESRRFGVFQVDEESRVLAFQEKPERGTEIPGRPGRCLGSMGIYIFETDALIRWLRADAEEKTTHDFGRDVIPRMIVDSPVHAHHFVGLDADPRPYWRDVGTIEAYFDANLDLCSVAPQFNLYEMNWPIYTLWHNDPPAKTVFDEENGRRASVVDSLLCPGVVVSGSSVRRSILSNRVFVDERASVEDSILFSGVFVGKGARIRRAIVDKWVRIPDDEAVGFDPEADARRFHVSSSGIVVVPRGHRF